jgi:type IV secretory pathway TrbD component
VEGFEVPVHHSITQPVLVGGAPREFAIINATISVSLVVGLGSLLGIPIGLILHSVAVKLAKKDPLFLDTFRRHIKQKSYYEA